MGSGGFKYIVYFFLIVFKILIKNEYLFIRKFMFIKEKKMGKNKIKYIFNFFI